MKLGFAFFRVFGVIFFGVRLSFVLRWRGAIFSSLVEGGRFW